MYWASENNLRTVGWIGFDMLDPEKTIGEPKIFNTDQGSQFTSEPSHSSLRKIT